MEDELLKRMVDAAASFMKEKGINQIEQVRYLAEASKRLYAQQIAFVLCTAPEDWRGKYLHHSTVSLDEMILSYEQAVKNEMKGGQNGEINGEGNSIIPEGATGKDGVPAN